jgi:hypothetical protein
MIAIVLRKVRKDGKKDNEVRNSILLRYFNHFNQFKGPIIPTAFFSGKIQQLRDNIRSQIPQIREIL